MLATKKPGIIYFFYYGHFFNNSQKGIIIKNQEIFFLIKNNNFTHFCNMTQRKIKTFRRTRIFPNPEKIKFLPEI